MRTLAVVALLTGTVAAVFVPADAEAGWMRKAIASQKASKAPSTLKKALPPKQAKQPKGQ